MRVYNSFSGVGEERYWNGGEEKKAEYIYT